MPKVSVCIPTYNTARYLPEAIESVLRQDFDDYELIICDNASTDTTPELCRRYTDPRFQYKRFDQLVNQAGNFNRCLEAARGEFITLLHADDIFLPGFLADRVKRLEENPGLDFVFGAVKIIDAAGAALSIKRHWDSDRTFAPKALLEDLLFACLISPPSLMVRRQAVEKAGAFRTDLTWGHDWDWTMRLAEKGGAAYASHPLAAYRVHDASGTAEILSAAKNGAQERRILHETFKRLSAESRLSELKRRAFQALSKRHMYFAEQALMRGKRRVARNNLHYAVGANYALLTRPTFWALLIGSLLPLSCYTYYRNLRRKFDTAAGVL